MKIKKIVMEGKSFNITADDHIDKGTLKVMVPEKSLMYIIEKPYDQIKEITGVNPDMLILGKKIIDNLKDDKDFQEAIDQTNLTPYPPSIAGIIKRGKLKYLGRYPMSKNKIYLFTAWKKSDDLPDTQLILCNSKLQNFF